MTLLYSNFSKVDSTCYDDLKWAKLPNSQKNSITNGFADKFCDGPGGADSTFTIKCKERNRPQYCNSSYRLITNKNPQIKQPVKQPVSTPVKQPVSTPVKQPVKQPVSTPVKQLVSTPVKQPVKQLVSTPVSTSVSTPVSTPDNEITYKKISSFNNTKSNFGKKNNKFDIILLVLIVFLILFLVLKK